MITLSVSDKKKKKTLSVVSRFILILGLCYACVFPFFHLEIGISSYGSSSKCCRHQSEKARRIAGLVYAGNSLCLNENFVFVTS